jgi:UPF0716 protein FxsA
MRLFLLLLPWLELATLIQLGVETSALTALCYVFVTLVLGILILRHQGQGLIRRLREAQAGQQLGSQLLVDDMALGLAALLLMFPGMITDVAALLVLIGPLRRRLLRAFGVQPAPSRPPERNAEGHVTIEGSYRRIDD